MSAHMVYFISSSFLMIIFIIQMNTNYNKKTSIRGFSQKAEPVKFLILSPIIPDSVNDYQNNNRNELVLWHSAFIQPLQS